MLKKNLKIVLSAIGILVVGGLIYYFLFLRTDITETDNALEIREDNIVTEKVTYVDTENNFTYEFNKNKVTKNATLDITYPVADEDVNTTGFDGEEATMAPFLINFTCAILNASFFDQEEFEEIAESFGNEGEAKPVTEDEEFAEILEDYTISSFTLSFIDQEDNEKIAKCSSNAAGVENITFEVYRDYSEIPSLFGGEIGVFEDEEETGK